MVTMSSRFCFIRNRENEDKEDSVKICDEAKSIKVTKNKAWNCEVFELKFWRQKCNFREKGRPKFCSFKSSSSWLRSRVGVSQDSIQISTLRDPDLK